MAVISYVRVPLSLRNIEDLLRELGIEFSPGTVRFGRQQFGPMFIVEIRNRLVSGLRASRRCWLLDEVFGKVNGVQQLLWRVVDHKEELLEAVVSYYK